MTSNPNEVLNGTSKWSLTEGDCLNVLKGLPESSLDSIVSDPPYGLSQHTSADVLEALRAWLDGKPYVPSKSGFMGKKWDAFVPGPEVWKEAFRVLKPGGHLLVFAGTRTLDLMGLAVRIAGFEFRDSIGCDGILRWQYGCLTPDTEILTPDGWILPNQSLCTDRTPVLSYDAQRNTFQWDPIQRYVEYTGVVDTLYHIQGELTDQKVTRDHRCPVVGENGRITFVSAEELAFRKEEVRVPVLKDMSLETFLGSCPVGDLLIAHRVQITPIPYEGAVWCIQVPTGAFVARRNGKMFLTGNSGFPKSHDISKAIDKEAGAVREVIGKHPSPAHMKSGNVTSMYTEGGSEEPDLTAPATDQAKKWSGWGTALKPSWEPVLVFRKPLTGTVAENTQEWGVGGIHVDACRVPTSTPVTINRFEDGMKPFGEGAGHEYSTSESMEGRWPSNTVLCHHPNCRPSGSVKVPGTKPGRKRRVMTSKGYKGGGLGQRRAADMPINENIVAGGFAGEDGKEVVATWECDLSCPVGKLNEQSGETGSHGGSGEWGNSGFIGLGAHEPFHYGDKGGAARFFSTFGWDPQWDAFYYCAKASRGEREEGLDESSLPAQEARTGLAGGVPVDDQGRDRDRFLKIARSTHPTVKPVSLMRWLIRLVTPKGGVVMDPFTGSGTTGVAAIQEGVRFVGAELMPIYVKIASGRLDHAERPQSWMRPPPPEEVVEMSMEDLFGGSQ